MKDTGLEAKIKREKEIEDRIKKLEMQYDNMFNLLISFFKEYDQMKYDLYAIVERYRNERMRSSEEIRDYLDHRLNVLNDTIEDIESKGLSHCEYYLLVTSALSEIKKMLDYITDTEEEG